MKDLWSVLLEISAEGDRHLLLPGYPRAACGANRTDLKPEDYYEDLSEGEIRCQECHAAIVAAGEEDSFETVMNTANKHASKKTRRKPMELPSVDNYHAHTQRDTVRAVRIEIGDVTVWFSYRTCIAFQVPGHDIVCHTNDWGPTTGGHMRSVGRYGTRKEDRVDSVTFHKLWNRLAVPALGGRRPRAPRKPRPPKPKPLPKLMESMEFRRKVTPSPVVIKSPVTA